MHNLSMCVATDISYPGTLRNADPAGHCHILQCCAITQGHWCPIPEPFMQMGSCELERSQCTFVIVISFVPGAGRNKGIPVEHGVSVRGEGRNTLLHLQGVLCVLSRHQERLSLLHFVPHVTEGQ